MTRHGKDTYPVFREPGRRFNTKRESTCSRTGVGPGNNSASSRLQTQISLNSLVIDQLTRQDYLGHPFP